MWLIGIARSDIGRVSALMGATAIVGCSDWISSPEPEERLELSVEVEPDIFAEGEEATIRITGYNPTGEALELMTPGGGPFGVRLLDEEGELMVIIPRSGTDEGLRHRVDPGDEVTSEWTFPPHHLEEPVEPGEYEVLAGIVDRDIDPETAPRTTFTIEPEG